MIVNAEHLFKPILKRSKANHRPQLQNCHFDKKNGELVACDGARLMVLLTEDKPKGAYVTPKDKQYPNYKQVVPGYQAGDLPNLKGKEHRVSTFRLLRPQLVEARKIMKDEPNDCVGLHFVKDDILVSCENSKGKKIKPKGVTKNNLMVLVGASMLIEILDIYHKIGGEDVFDVYIIDDLSPVTIIGEEVYTVLMPMRKNN